MKLQTGTKENKGGFGPGYNKAQFSGVEPIQSKAGIFYGYKFQFSLLKDGENGLEPTKFNVDFSATEKLDKPIKVEEVEANIANGNVKWNKTNKAMLLEALGLGDTDDIVAEGEFLKPVQVWLRNEKDNKGIDRLRMAPFKQGGKVVIAGDVDGASVVAQPVPADDF